MQPRQSLACWEYTWYPQQWQTYAWAKPGRSWRVRSISWQSAFSSYTGRWVDGGPSSLSFVASLFFLPLSPTSLPPAPGRPFRPRAFAVLLVVPFMLVVEAIRRVGHEAIDNVPCSFTAMCFGISGQIEVVELEVEEHDKALVAGGGASQSIALDTKHLCPSDLVVVE